MAVQRIPKVIAVVVGLFAFTLFAQTKPPSAYNNEGVEAFNAGNFELAISLLEQAYALAPDSTIVQRNLCNAYQGKANELGLKKDFRRALPLLEKAIQVDPGNHSPRIQAGSYYLNIGDVNAAIRHLEEAIRIKPGELNAHELLGQAYYMDNDLSSARAQWEYVLEMDPARTDLRQRYEKAFREESVEYDFNRWKSRHFRISYPPDVPAVTRTYVSSILDRAYIDIGRMLGGVYPPPPIQVVLYTADQFAEATQMEGHIGAVYDGKIRSPLTDANGQWLSEEELERRLVHEYVHVVVRTLAGDGVPWWVNEGLAESLSKSLGSADRERIKAVFTSGLAVPFSQLESNQVLSKNPIRLKDDYLQSHAAIDMLWTRYGRSKMTAFLRSINSGVAPEEALRSVFRLSYADLEWDLAYHYR